MGATTSKLDSKNLIIHEKIGEGGFGFVHRVTFRKQYKGYTEAAAKTVFDIREDEVKIMGKLDHPHIVKLLGFCQSGHVDIIVMEYAPFGSLHECLSNSSKKLSDDLKMKWIRESALAVHYLHAHRVLHRDIKPQNCLLFHNNLLKLCDFGVAREIDHSQTTSSQKGTYRYMAPEIHKGNERGRVTYSKPADIYAYGMLMLETCTRKAPFHGWEWQAVVFKVASGAKPPLPNDVPQDIRNIMERCWNHDPKDRPTIEEVVDVVCDWLLEKTIIPEREPQRRSSAPHARNIRRVACLPNGDMAIVDRSKLHILDSEGNIKTPLQTSPTAERENQIGWVWGIAITQKSNQIAVVDDRRHAKVFERSGEYVRSISTTSGDEVINQDNIMSVAMDTEDNILVGDSGSNTIAIHSNSDGRLLNRVKCDSMVDTSRMVVNSKDEIIYCSHPTDSDHPCVVAVDKCGNQIFAFTPSIEECMSPGKVVESGGIICDTCDNIYVSLNVRKGLYFDPYTGHIHKYSSAGSFLKCIANRLYHPLDLAITSDSLSMVVANRNSILVLALK
ncbi:uncharacterized protein [Amphiura filiformis]|uniref:uncharacterized protein n=1 Tax=Amphiura filiformis TaxID=82378 RepID=UPI003B21570B